MASAGCQSNYDVQPEWQLQWLYCYAYGHSHGCAHALTVMHTSKHVIDNLVPATSNIVCSQ